jgi:hypothetical protein
VKHQKTAVRKRPVTRTPEPSTESPLTLEQVREAVEMTWTDATRLPTTPGSLEVCEHLKSAAECLDGMIEHVRSKSLRRGTINILRELASRSHRWTQAKELDERDGEPSVLLRPLVGAGFVERNRIGTSGRRWWLYRITTLGQEKLKEQP